MRKTFIAGNWKMNKTPSEAVAFANTQIVTIGVETITKNIRMSAKLKRIVNNMFCNNQIQNTDL